MKCEECEKAVYIYRELSTSEKERVDVHVQTCTACQQVLTEMQQVNILIKKSSQALPRHSNPEWLTNRIMASLEVKSKKPRTQFPLFDSIFEISKLRHAMALISVILLLMFFVELGGTGSEKSKIKGPIAKLQTVILKNETFGQGFTTRQDFTARKEKKQSWLAKCVSPLTKNLDFQCVKEKFKNTQY